MPSPREIPQDIVTQNHQARSQRAVGFSGVTLTTEQSNRYRTLAATVTSKLS